MSESGIETVQTKIDSIKIWSVPKSTKAVRPFPGFIGYYHRFFLNFASIARHLNKLLVGRTWNFKQKERSADSKQENTIVQRDSYRAFNP